MIRLINWSAKHISRQEIQKFPPDSQFVKCGRAQTFPTAEIVTLRFHIGFLYWTLKLIVSRKFSTAKLTRAVTCYLIAESPADL